MIDLIDRGTAIDEFYKCPNGIWTTLDVMNRLSNLPSAQPEIVRCKDCKWWEKKEDSSLGYCNAVKHCHFSDHLEIQIYSRYEPDFFYANGERRSYDDMERV